MDELTFDDMMEDMALAVSQVAMLRGITNVPNLRVITTLQPIFEHVIEAKPSLDVVADEPQYPDL